MPEMKEVYEMVVSKAPPKPDAEAWQRLADRRRRAETMRRVGAYSLAAALIVGVLVLVLVTRRSTPTGIATSPPTPSASVTGSTAPQIVSIDGGVLRRLSGLPAGSQGLRLSPDGQTIAFIVHGQVATIGIDGTGLTVLTEGTNTNTGDEMNAVSWSPDGKQLVYAWSGDIHVIDADGANDRTIVTTPSGDYEPTWSPDGSTIAYWHGASSGIEGGPPNAEIYSVPATGGRPTRLTRATGGVGSIDPAWSPDGTRIAYASRHELWVMRSNGTARRLVYGYDVGGETFAPVWSPDGKKIAFLTFSSYTPGGLLSLWEVDVLDLETGEATSLGMTVETDSNAPQWVTNRTLLVNRFG